MILDDSINQRLEMEKQRKINNLNTKAQKNSDYLRCSVPDFTPRLRYLFSNPVLSSIVILITFES